MPAPPSPCQRVPALPVARIAALLAVLLAAWAFVAAVAPAAEASPGRPPVLDGDAPDPALVRDGSTFHLYTTNTGLGNVPVWHSASLDRWGFGGDALPRLGSWANPGLTWAPDVARVAHPDGNHWVLYYVAHHRASGRQCVGRAIGTTPAGPFTDGFPEPLVCQAERGGSIDASFFTDPATGARWLYWKSDENAIGKPTHLWTWQLDQDGLGFVGLPTAVLSQDRAWEQPLIEQPEMVHAAGRYWLFYSANWWESANYGMGYAACAGPAGPCRKVTTNGPWHHSTPHAAGPGAASFETDAQGRLWMAYHGWPQQVGYAHGGRRATYVTRVTFGSQGPQLHADVPAWMANSTRRFYDVAPDSPHDASVRWLAAGAVTSGCGPDRYCATAPVTRAQMATFLWRLNGSPRPAGPARFTDVDGRHVHADAIAWLVERGVTVGVTPDRFAPQTRVSREQMATFLWRMSGQPAAPPHVFRDASHNGAVNWMVDSGVTRGCTTDRFCGGDAVSRDQMASFLWRHQGSPAV